MKEQKSKKKLITFSSRVYFKNVDMNERKTISLNGSTKFPFIAH